MKFAFILAEKATWPIVVMCAVHLMPPGVEHVLSGEPPELGTLA
jgi:hypothetical protein